MMPQARLGRPRLGWILLSLAGSFIAAAQSAAPVAAQESTRTGRGYLQVGYQSLDLSDLNARLASQGIPKFSEGFVTLGGGGHVERGRLLIGGEGQALIEQTETTAAFQRKLSGALGFVDIGVLLGRRPRGRLYPFVGIGGGGVMLKTIERATLSFDQVLAEPRRGSDIGVGGLLMQVGLGADVLLGSSATAENPRGLGVGVRGGYIFAPASAEWRLGKNELAGGPDVDLGGFYVRVSLGGVGGRR